MKGAYEWVAGREPWNVPLAEPPVWLTTLALPKSHNYERQSPREPWGIDEEAIGPIAAPGRNNALTKVCGLLFRARSGCGSLSYSSVLPQVKKDLLRINTTKCRPPLSTREVEKIAWSISRKG